MHIPKNTTWGPDSAPEARYELLNNPITYEIILMIAVVSFAMSLLGIMRCLQSCIAPDDGQYDFENQQGDDEEAQPLGLTHTADDGPLNNDSGGEYGTFYVDNGRWYNADGVEMIYNDWVEAVYDPLD